MGKGCAAQERRGLWVRHERGWSNLQAPGGVPVLPESAAMLRWVNAQWPLIPYHEYAASIAAGSVAGAAAAAAAHPSVRATTSDDADEDADARLGPSLMTVSEEETRKLITRRSRWRRGGWSPISTF